MAGVDSVQLSLNEGLARILLKPGNQLRLAQLREIVANSGFTPREARVTVIGQVVLNDGETLLRVAKTGEMFDLSIASKASKTEDELKKEAGKNLLIEGILAPVKQEKMQVLEVLTFKEEQEETGG